MVDSRSIMLSGGTNIHLTIYASMEEIQCLDPNTTFSEINLFYSKEMMQSSEF